MIQKNHPPVPTNSNFRLLPVSPGSYCIISPEDYPQLKNYVWREVRAHFGTYIKATYTAKGRRHTVAMHRVVARTPFGMVCHHINGKTFDNRRQNLRNMSKIDHKLLHRNNSLMIKHTPPVPDQKQI